MGHRHGVPLRDESNRSTTAKISRHPGLVNLSDLKLEDANLGTICSLLGLRILDRKGRVVAIVEVLNKKGSREGRPDSQVAFGQDDESVAHVLANVIALTLV